MAEGEVQTRFRSRKESIDRKLNRIQNRLKEETSHRKTSVNQVLNFSVVLADIYLDRVQKEIGDMEIEVRELKNQIEEQKAEIREATEF